MCPGFDPLGSIGGKNISNGTFPAVLPTYFYENLQCMCGGCAIFNLFLFFLLLFEARKRGNRGTEKMRNE